jgi:gluconate 5-dehydrogenase
LGAIRHYCECDRAGLPSVEDDEGVIEAVGIDEMVSGVPLQRLGDGDDLKGAAVLFASDAGKHITGQILAIDGGLTAVTAF